MTQDEAKRRAQQFVLVMLRFGAGPFESLAHENDRLGTRVATVCRGPEHVMRVTAKAGLTVTLAGRIHDQTTAELGRYCQFLSTLLGDPTGPKAVS